MKLPGWLAGLVLLVSPLPAQEPRDVTVEWIFSDEGEALGKLPSTQWTSLGLLLLDARRDKGERTIERVRPDTGSRTNAVNARAALDSLRPLLEAKDVPDALEWPAGFDAAGRRAVYVLAEDLFLLEIGSSRFERVTRTSEKEELPRLSPDGTKLAFVRGHDLHLLDLATRTEKRLTRDGSAAVLNGKLSWVYWEEVFDRADTGYWWSEDSAAIAFLRTDESSVPAPEPGHERTLVGARALGFPVVAAGRSHRGRRQGRRLLHGTREGDVRAPVLRRGPRRHGPHPPLP